MIVSCFSLRYVYLGRSEGGIGVDEVEVCIVGWLVWGKEGVIGLGEDVDF